jgi:hypothetical protein
VTEEVSGSGSVEINGVIEDEVGEPRNLHIGSSPVSSGRRCVRDSSDNPPAISSRSPVWRGASLAI